MLFLILLVPMTLLGAILAWMCWRTRQRRMALVMAGISLVCAGVSAAILLVGFFLCGAVQVPASG